ncbi:TetR family transcriptional regulator [Mycobacterium sp.]|uniref:TetR family transcriptional regulator n=1 Tax=Mycobacterium sp. TaxID=1785 RepID=UPI003BB6F1EA
MDRSRDASILHAALAALAKHGYEATNMNDVAAQAGAAPPSTSISIRRGQLAGRLTDRHDHRKTSSRHPAGVWRVSLGRNRCGESSHRSALIAVRRP